MDAYSEPSTRRGVRSETAVNGVTFSHGFDDRKSMWLLHLSSFKINFTSTLCACVRVRER